MKGFLNIVIIGSSRGIGREVAKQLCFQGHNLACISRDETALFMLQKECSEIKPGNPVNTIALDITKIPEYPVRLKDRIGAIFSRVDILLYNAGLLISKDFTDFNHSEIFEIFNVNFISASRVIKELLPLMGGEKISHIVTIGSMGGFQGSAKFRGLSFYSSSKAALACLSECLALELNDRNIYVNCLALGSAQTEMLEKAFPGYRAPLTAAEMAEFISHFMVSGHKYFNGKVIPVSSTTP
jgi:short-subunit dehydrogenase